MKLSKRLQACAALVTPGCRLADIGCDHGYIPVYLVQSGRITAAIASDINERPLSACRSLVAQCGYEAQITCVLSDGTEKLDLDAVDDLLLAGMGGELIASILSAAGDLRGKHLVLNPMTHPELARRWLYENGFEIAHDLILEDAGHHYSVLDAAYTGHYTEADDVRCFLGNINDFSDRAYFEHLLRYLRKKQKGGFDYREVIAAIEEKINDDC
ncbi:MAG: SAM-dependent methyltransferase [Eubacterium sp.]|nr:SAM-dependent methyltransferase [Eubacterium sp.]